MLKSQNGDKSSVKAPQNVLTKLHFELGFDQMMESETPAEMNIQVIWT